MAGEAFWAVFLCVIDLKVIDAAVGERCGREVQYWAQAGGCEVAAIIMPSESYMLANVDGNPRYSYRSLSSLAAHRRSEATRRLCAKTHQPVSTLLRRSAQNQLLVA